MKRSRNRVTDKVQDAVSIVMDFSQQTDPSIEAKAFDRIQNSNPVWEENVRIRDEVATLKVTVCDPKWQLREREDANSKLQLKKVVDKTKFYVGYHPL